MKYFLILSFIILVNTNCKKANSPSCFKVKKIGQVCDWIIWQIQDPAYYHLGQNNWTSQNRIILDHVFTMQNPCTEITVDANNEALVQNVNNGGNNCITCLAVYPNAPSTRVAISPCP